MEHLEVDEIVSTAHHVIEVALPPRGAIALVIAVGPNVRGGFKGKLRFPGGTHSGISASMETPSVQPKNLQMMG